MGARDLLQDLAHAGLSVAADGDRLVIRPASKLTDAQRTALRQQKAEVLALLTATRAPEPRPYRLIANAAARCHADGWNAAEIERFGSRVLLFIRRGVSATDADDLAESLTLRDREGQGVGMCLECASLSGRNPSNWRCRDADAAGVAPELPADLVTQCQRCPAWKPNDRGPP